jgi:glycogen(starch) synthase
MRVLITTDVVGGVWQFTHELANGLLRKGSAVALVSVGGHPTPEHSQQCARLRSEYGDNAFLYESVAAPLEWMQQNDSAYHDAAPTLLRVAKEFSADVLHANQFCFGALPVEIPKIITAHSDVLSWAEACRNTPMENSRWLQQYCRLVADGLEGARALVAPSKWMLNALRRNFTVRARCSVIYNGRTIPPAESAIRQLRAVTAGRLWDEAKDIRLLAGVLSAVPLYVAGDKQHEASRVQDDLGSLTMLGRLSEQELLEFFRESAIYICTSRYEPFGLAPLEAALCGCAVLARDIPSLREVWQDGARYFSDVQTLSALLDELARDPDSLHAAQRRSSKRAISYNAERMVKAYHAEFTRVLNEAEVRTHAA